MAGDEISAVQFVTVLVAVGVAATGLLTLFLANRRLRAERALPAVQRVRRRAGGIEVDIQNVGLRTCLDIVVVTSAGSALVIGALQPGEQLSVGIPIVCCVDVEFRDTAGIRRMIRRYIEWSGGRPFLALPAERGWAMRFSDRLGFTFGD